MAHHYLKTETQYFQSVEKGIKKFELRKNDRNFQVHDVLHLEEVVNDIRTGRRIGPLHIKYILHGGSYGLDEDYCVLNW